MFDINKMLENNKLFVENGEYKNFNTTKPKQKGYNSDLHAWTQQTLSTKFKEVIE